MVDVQLRPTEVAHLNYINSVLDWPTEISAMTLALAFGIAAMIGILFGYYPARRASRLDPIDSLRYE